MAKKFFDVVVQVMRTETYKVEAETAEEARAFMERVEWDEWIVETIDEVMEDEPKVLKVEETVMRPGQRYLDKNWTLGRIGE